MSPTLAFVGNLVEPDKSMEMAEILGLNTILLGLDDDLDLENRSSAVATGHVCHPQTRTINADVQILGTWWRTGASGMDATAKFRTFNHATNVTVHFSYGRCR